MSFEVQSASSVLIASNHVDEDIYSDTANDWSFASLKTSETLWGPHGYHRYPAKFIPQLVCRLIEMYSAPGELVGDPFLGSATTGIEDLRLDNAPRVGKRYLTEAEKDAITATDIVRATSEERFRYWFPAAYRESLEAILQRILAYPEGAIRTFFLCGFSNILKRCSIWLSGSTRSQKDVCKVPGDPVDEFRRQIRDMIKRNHCYWDDLVKHGLQPTELIDQCCIRGEDARQLTLPDAALDLVVA